MLDNNEYLEAISGMTGIPLATTPPAAAVDAYLCDASARTNDDDDIVLNAGMFLTVLTMGKMTTLEPHQCADAAANLVVSDEPDLSRERADFKQESAPVIDEMKHTIALFRGQ